MEDPSKMAKVSYKGKTLLTSRPKNIPALKNVFRKKFKVNSFKDKHFIYKDGEDEINIETEEDLRNIYLYVEGCVKIQMLGKIPEQQTDNPINMDHLSLYVKFLDNAMPYLTEEVSQILAKDEIPCKECFFNKEKDTSFDLDDDYCCDVCKDKRSVELTKSWKLILLLIDYKIKQYLLDPLNAFREGSGEKHSFDESHVTNERPCNYLDHSFESNTNSRIVGQQGFSNFVLNNTGSLANTFTEQSSQNRVFPSVLNHLQPNNISDKIYTKIQLDFNLDFGSFAFSNKNGTVKLFIENNNDIDWPEGICIKGKFDDSAETEVSHYIKRVVKKNCLTSLKFDFAIPETKEEITKATLCFKLIDEDKGIIYKSKEFEIDEEKDKNQGQRFKFCSFL